MPQCSTCSPARCILYPVTVSCKGPIAVFVCIHVIHYYITSQKTFELHLYALRHVFGKLSTTYLQTTLVIMCYSVRDTDKLGERGNPREFFQQESNLSTSNDQFGRCTIELGHKIRFMCHKFVFKTNFTYYTFHRKGNKKKKYEEDII